ncbi:hypothetical protein HGB07_04245 [Candidatus Roizmanbacteria bacterium]|nr:hypothetical protein [Candidatus Roizmanbacteria bacterium]
MPFVHYYDDNYTRQQVREIAKTISKDPHKKKRLIEQMAIDYIENSHCNKDISTAIETSITEHASHKNMKSGAQIYRESGSAASTSTHYRDIQGLTLKHRLKCEPTAGGNEYRAALTETEYDFKPPEAEETA